MGHFDAWITENWGVVPSASDSNSTESSTPSGNPDASGTSTTAVRQSTCPTVDRDTFWTIEL